VVFPQVWARGEKYEGWWLKGKRSGQGTCTFPDGRKYSGAWADGKMHGVGSMTFSNGEK
jgi:hypothetical protein